MFRKADGLNSACQKCVVYNVLELRDEPPLMSIGECHQYLEGIELSDQQVEELRDTLYALIRKVFDEMSRREAFPLPLCVSSCFLQHDAFNEAKALLCGLEAILQTERMSGSSRSTGTD